MRVHLYVRQLVILHLHLWGQPFNLQCSSLYTLLTLERPPLYARARVPESCSLPLPLNGPLLCATRMVRRELSVHIMLMAYNLGRIWLNAEETRAT